MKLFKFICGTDEKIGIFPDEAAAYERRMEVDPTFGYLPFLVEEVTLPGYVIMITPVFPVETAGDGVKDEMKSIQGAIEGSCGMDIAGMNADQLKAWLDDKGVKYHSQNGEKKLRELVQQTLLKLKEN